MTRKGAQVVSFGGRGFLNQNLLNHGLLNQNPVSPARSVLAVVAHPDDESFGLGAVLDLLTTAGVRCGVLCFTRGEASTLHAGAGHLAEARSAEFAAAAAVLRLDHADLLGYPDGGLSAVPLAELTGRVLQAARETAPGHLLTFDVGGVTGHPDHARATEAALAAAEVLDIPVLGWTLPEAVTRMLNTEFGAAFTGRDRSEIDETLSVDRAGQRRAIGCHASQSTANPVLWRRLELLGNEEHLRLLFAGSPQGRRDSPEISGEVRMETRK
ncbi:MAG: PIG-L family deacetylase [Micromonosporaceae bacterium]